MESSDTFLPPTAGSQETKILRYSYHRVIVLVAVCLTSMLSACETPLKGPAFKAVPKPEVQGDKGIVYVFRTDEKSGYVGQKLLALDGKEILDLQDGEFTWLRLEPGSHELSAETRWSKRALFEEYRPPKVRIDVKAGMTQYVHLYFGVNVKGQKTSVSIVGETVVPYTEPVVEYSHFMKVVDEEHALKILENKLYQPIAQ